ncbi:MAG: PD40 domain-containing protein [Chloroflexi bacterium]|nr:PD40 domain-containing protein [Chloroflexota bacterium]
MRPAQLQHIWFPYYPATNSAPQLHTVLVDQQGQRWGQTDVLAKLDLRAGYPGPRLVGLHSSPNGQYIAADVFYGDNGSVWLIELGSGRTRRILKNQESIGHFIAWSPDNRKILFRAESTKGEIWLVDVSDESHQRLNLPVDQFGSTTVQSAVFSPDGSRIAYRNVVQPTVAGQTSSLELWNMSLDGTNKQQVLKVSDASTVEGGLLWSSATNQLLYIRQPDLNSSNKLGELWAIDLSTYLPRKLDTGILAEWPTYPVLAPNDTIVAYAKKNRDLWMFDLSSNRARQVLGTADKAVANPTWSPDSAFLVFISNQADYSVIFAASTDGSRVYPIAGPAPLESPVVWIR